MIKTFSKLRLEGKIFNMIKGIYEKPRTSIILMGKNLNVFPLRSRTQQGCPLLPQPLNIILEVLEKQLGKKKNKRKNWEGKSKTSYWQTT